MARRRTISGRVGSRQVIRPSWAAGFSLGGSGITVAAGTKVLLATFTLSGAFEETILRSRVRFAIKADATGETQVGAFGMIIVTDEAEAAGAASIPGPSSQSENDGWFVHQPIVQYGDTGTTNENSYIYDVDSKAMRKVSQGHSMVVMVENPQVTTGGFLIQYFVRILAKVTQG